MNKSMVVAMWDFKNALKLKMVKYGLGMAALFGPAMVILMVVGPALAMSPSDFLFYSSILVPIMAPMLGLFAVIPTTMIAANALVGEREQNTLEPLLCTPLTDRQLLWGKTLSSAIPSLIILVISTFGSTISVLVILAVMGYPLILVPDIPGFFLLFTASPLLILSVVAVMILISGRVTRVYEAYQVSSGVIAVFLFPMFLPFVSIGSGVVDLNLVWFGDIITLIISALLFAITWALALARFNRDKLVSLV
jgi:ABC-2 type transport system permease protein